MVIALFINLVVLPRAEKSQESVIQSGPQPTALPPAQQPVQLPAPEQAPAKK
jgi:hypothetical protein